MAEEKSQAERIALAGLEIGAIKLRPDNPFQWASGYRMPIYNDNRMFLTHPDYRELIQEAFIHMIEEEEIPYDIIAGTSTAGIPHAAILAHSMDDPMIYVRDKPKGHGLRNQIEGIDAEKDLSGKKVIVIEDLVSTGGSSARAVKAIRDANGACNYCLSIFNYGFDRAVQKFAEVVPGCQVVSLLDYDRLLDAVKRTDYFNAEELKILGEWRDDPWAWGERHGFPKVEKDK